MRDRDVTTSGFEEHRHIYEILLSISILNLFAVIRPPDIVSWRTYVLPGIISSFSPPNLKCVDNYKGSPTSSQNVMNFGPQTAYNSFCIFTHPL